MSDNFDGLRKLWRGNLENDDVPTDAEIGRIPRVIRAVGWTLLTIAGAMVILLLLVLVNFALAAPVAVAKDATRQITLHDDPCLLEAIENLPLRATWEERTRTFEGCWERIDGLIVTYWSDRTVVLFELRHFRPLGSI